MSEKPCRFTIPGWCGMMMAAALCLAFGRATAAPPKASITLAHEGAAIVPIVSESQFAPVAQDLADYLKRISGATFKVVTADRMPDGPAIIIGAFSRTDARDLPGDSFIQRADAASHQLQIYGSTALATRHAVYDLLETRLGCRWWSSFEEDVPHQTTLTLPAFENIHRAVFIQTDLRNREAYQRQNHFADKLGGVSTMQHTTSHAMHDQVAAFGKTHPEIYPYSKKTGKRAKNNIHLCYTNPDLPEVIADALEKEIAKRRGDVTHTLYMSDMGDAYGGYCQCETCRKIYDEEVWTRDDGSTQQAYSSTLLRLINKTAAILEARHPGAKVITQAYMTLEGPPGKTVPRDNVYIRVPHLRHCIIHGIDQCIKNRRYYTDLKRWCELAPGRVYVWDYTVNFKENFLHPMPNIRSIARNIQVYADLGVAGMTLQGNYVSTGGDLVVLKNFVWSKMLDDPTRDVDELIRTFCRGYYGPAAEPVMRYVFALEDAAQNCREHLDEFAELGDLRKLLTRELRQELAGHIDSARQAAAGIEPYQRRVEELAVSLESINLAGEYPLVAEGDKLLRQYPSGNVYTYDRAVKMLEHSRESSFREWAAFRTYHQSFLPLQGGPLPMLHQGDVKVQVAPAQALRVWQIYFRDQPLLNVPNDPKDKNFPRVGGVYEILSPLFVHGKLESEPTATRVCMTATHESGSTIKADSRKCVSLDENGGIRITYETRTANAKTGWTTAGGSFDAQYVFNPQGASPVVEVMTPTGAWTPVELSRQGKQPLEAQLPDDVTAVRITLPDKGCRVIDTLGDDRTHYLGGNVTVDWRGGVLTISLRTRRVPINDQTLTHWATRLLTIEPLPTDPE